MASVIAFEPFVFEPFVLEPFVFVVAMVVPRVRVARLRCAAGVFAQEELLTEGIGTEVDGKIGVATALNRRVHIGHLLDAPADEAFASAGSRRRPSMSVYRVTDIIGTSAKSWEEAAREALATAASSLRDLRVAEVVAQDITLADDGKIESFRTKLRVSFKYEK
jgi:flavin-binding protein dodecin